MIGFSSLSYPPPPQNQVFPHSNANNGGLKRLASSREELERSWHSDGSFSNSARAHVLHSISCSGDEIDNEERCFKRQRTNDSVDVVDRNNPLQHVVSGVRIHPENRPPKLLDAMDMEEQPNRTRALLKPGWYTGQLGYCGNRHGFGSTTHDDGTAYQGSYVNDAMEGNGKYKFTPLKQLVTLDGTRLHRVTETVFEGNFVNDEPKGKGMFITTIIDSVPERIQSSGIDVKYVKVMYDVGYYKANGKACGEGVRFTYTRTSMTDWEEVCTRTNNGECTGLVVGRSYGVWVCDCLGLDGYPQIPTW